MPRPTFPSVPAALARLRRLVAGLALRDVAVVVVGILIAFALDAWWQQRASTSRVRAHSAALTVDFRQNVERLNGLVAREERVVRGSRGLLLHGRGREEAPPDSLWGMLAGVLSTERFEPVLGTYRELESSGGLTLLRDDSLRAALAAFTAQLDVRYYERFADEIYLAFVRDFSGEISVFAPYVAEDGRDETIADLQRLLGTRRFQEYLALRHISARDVAGEYRRLLEQAEVVLARLEKGR